MEGSTKVSGKELIEQGLTVELKDKPGAAVIIYRRLKRLGSDFPQVKLPENWLNFRLNFPVDALGPVWQDAVAMTEIKNPFSLYLRSVKCQRARKKQLLVRNSLTYLLSLVFFMFSACSGKSAASSEILSETFNRLSPSWQELSLSSGKAGLIEIKEGQLRISAQSPLQGVYHQQTATGHFFVEAAFAQDKNVGLALIQEKNGKPDVENYTMICVDQGDRGLVVVRVKDCQNGKRDVLDNTRLTDFSIVPDSAKEQVGTHLGEDLYEQVLTGTQYSVPFTNTDKKIRIFREANGGFFHFYYGVRKTIHGKEASDWMELRPSKDWAKPGTQYYAALVALNKGEAVFNSIKALQKPRADLDDRQTGFKVTQREYNWSGFYGDALVVSFDQTFPGTIAILSMFSGPR